MTKEAFIQKWEEWLAKEFLLAYHAHHNIEWLVRATKNLPEKCRRLLAEAYTAAEEAAKEEVKNGPPQPGVKK